jgi:hypothetical protein
VLFRSEWSFPVWPWMVSGFIVLFSLIKPECLGPLNKLLLRVSGPLGRVNSVIVLALIYFIFVCPMGFLMRLLRKDPISREFDPASQTYRSESESSSSMEMPF